MTSNRICGTITTINMCESRQDINTTIYEHNRIDTFRHMLMRRYCGFRALISTHYVVRKPQARRRWITRRKRRPSVCAVLMINSCALAEWNARWCSSSCVRLRHERRREYNEIDDFVKFIERAITPTSSSNRDASVHGISKYREEGGDFEQIAKIRTVTGF